MKLIAGLGNPGAEYDGTRHNAGFAVVDGLATRHAPGQLAKSRFQGVTLDAAIGGAGSTEKVVLLKPMTFMNLSGRSVGEAVRFFKLDPSTDLLVVIDDLALPVGQIRVRGSGSHGGHNGLKDIDRALGFAGEREAPYARLRVGIGAVPAGADQVGYVLGRVRAEERGEVDASLARAADAAAVWATEGIEPAMNRYNARAGAGW